MLERFSLKPVSIVFLYPLIVARGIASSACAQAAHEAKLISQVKKEGGMVTGCHLVSTMFPRQFG